MWCHREAQWLMMATLAIFAQQGDIARRAGPADIVEPFGHDGRAPWRHSRTTGTSTQVRNIVFFSYDAEYCSGVLWTIFRESRRNRLPQFGGTGAASDVLEMCGKR